MALEDSDIPADVRDILEYMPPEMRRRVQTDYASHYAPFLGMLAGWKQAIQEHYRFGEESAIARLQEQFFPLGEWKFPAQTLAVPARAVERTTEVSFGADFKEAGNRPWIASGEGWLQPTSLHGAWARQARQKDQEEPQRPGKPENPDWIVALDINYLGATPLSLLTRGQLAFVAAEDSFVSLLAAGQWWVEVEGESPMPAQCERYEGFLGFEREMQTARINQRPLEHWLPPFHPYARKMVCWQAAPNTEDATLPSEFAEIIRQFPREGNARLMARLSPRTEESRRVLRALAQGADGSAIFALNAVPILQAAVSDNVFDAPFPRIGPEFALRMAALPGLFAAVTYADGLTVPATMARLPGANPLAPQEETEVRFAQGDANVARIRLYYNASGQERLDGADTPESLIYALTKFNAPFPLLGGVTVADLPKRAETTVDELAARADMTAEELSKRAGVPVETLVGRAAWARAAWYQSTLRPPLLTEGDIQEIVRQQNQGALTDKLRLVRVERDILRNPTSPAGCWTSYLWPSILGNAAHFDPRNDGLSGRFTPLLQTLRLCFTPTSQGAQWPDFLQREAAHYLASTISAYFVLSCFRIEGGLEGGG